METMDQHYEGLPEGAQVLGEINSTGELKIGKTYFNASNGKLALFLGQAMSPDDFKVRYLWTQIDPVTGGPAKSEASEDEDTFPLPLLHVKLPEGFLELFKTPAA